MNKIELGAAVDKHFPHKTFNPGQREAIVQIAEALLSGKKHIVLEAPTGIGKSAIATTVHRVIKEAKASWRTTIITATKGLQDQYEQEDKEIYSLKGKTNYECPLGVGPYNSAGCRKMVHTGGCRKAVICPYYKTRVKWCLESPLRLTNTSFQIEACPSIIMRPENRADMIIIDECHSIDEHLVNHSSLTLNLSEMTHASDDIKGRLASFVNEFVDNKDGDALTASPDQRDLAGSLSSYLEGYIQVLEEKMKTEGKRNDSVAGTVEELQQITDKLSGFSKLGGEWILMKFAFAMELELKPVYASQVAEHGLFRKADQFIHMSATVCGYSSYIKTLGIAAKDSVYIEVANPIPVANRKVFAMDAIKVSGNFDRDRLAMLIDKIIARHEGQNGIIHSVSFALAEEIKALSKNKKRMLISRDRREIIDFLSKPNAGIVVSPSIEQGYDFKGDMSRFQIIPKVPFHYIGDKWVSLNMNRHPEWYARKAILRTVQAAGRSVRGVDDYASTYIIDENFTRLLQRNRDIFPKWFLESIV
jgi:Rad3-related DNA helicase